MNDEPVATPTRSHAPPTHVLATQDVTVATLTLTNLTRAHIHAVLECQATNSDTALPRASSVSIDMNCEYQETLISIKEL